MWPFATSTSASRPVRSKWTLSRMFTHDRPTTLQLTGGRPRTQTPDGSGQAPVNNAVSPPSAAEVAAEIESAASDARRLAVAVLEFVDLAFNATEALESFPLQKLNEDLEGLYPVFNRIQFRCNKLIRRLRPDANEAKDAKSIRDAARLLLYLAKFSYNAAASSHNIEVDSCGPEPDLADATKKTRDVAAAAIGLFCAESPGQSGPSARAVFQDCLSLLESLPRRSRNQAVDTLADPAAPTFRYLRQIVQLAANLTYLIVRPDAAPES